MAELSELRTRLEGSLERVERMTESLERAVAHASSGKTAGLTRVLEARADDAMTRALTAVEKLAATEPVLAPVLERFRRAEERVRAALLAQTATLGVYEGDSLELARLLKRERPLYSGHAVGWGEVVLLVLFAAFVSLRLSFLRHGAEGVYTLWWVPLVAVAGGVAWRLRGPKLVVTPGFVRLGAEVLRVADVKRLRITRVAEGFGRNRRHVYEFSAESPTGRSRGLELRAATVPDGFVQALMHAGIDVRRERFD